MPNNTSWWYRSKKAPCGISIHLQWHASPLLQCKKLASFCHAPGCRGRSKPKGCHRVCINACNQSEQMGNNQSYRFYICAFSHSKNGKICSRILSGWLCFIKRRIKKKVASGCLVRTHTENANWVIKTWRGNSSYLWHARCWPHFQALTMEQRAAKLESPSSFNSKR